MNPTVKKIGIGVIVTVLIYCLLSIGFYGLVAMCFPKTVNHIVEAGAIKDTYIWEVEYWSNVNGNGVELLDIRINGFLDANQLEKEDSMLYSKGLQIVGGDNESIQFTTYTGATTGTVLGSIFFTTWWGFVGWDYNVTYHPNLDCYYYDTQNGVSFDSINEFGVDTYFKVPIKNNGTEELYVMKLNGISPEPTSTIGSIYQSRYYDYYDINYLASKLLDVVRHNNIGYDATGTLVAEFGDCFSYRKYSDTTGEWINSKETDLYKIIKENFCEFKLTTHADGANYGSDSMFGMVANSSDFEYLPDGYIDDYFVGKQVLTLTEDNFSSNDGILVINDTTAKYLANNKDKNILVKIDTEKLNEKGITFKEMSAEFIATYRSRLVSIKINNTEILV